MRYIDRGKKLAQRTAKSVYFHGSSMVNPGKNDILKKVWHPDHMTREQALSILDYVESTPNFWRIECQVYWRDRHGGEWFDSFEGDTMQSCRREYALDLQKQGFDTLLESLNPNLITAFRTVWRII